MGYPAARDQTAQAFEMVVSAIGPDPFSGPAGATVPQPRPMHARQIIFTFFRTEKSSPCGTPHTMDATRAMNRGIYQSETPSIVALGKIDTSFYC